MVNRVLWVFPLLMLSLPALADQDVVCESVGKKYQQCAIAINGEVELVDQLSRSSCVRGRSWDYDRYGIWVDRGCRARFRIYDNRFGHSSMNTGFSVQACQNEIAQRIRREGGGGDVQFDRAERRAVDRKRDEITGYGRVRDQSFLQRQFNYQCQVDTRRQRIDYARHDYEQLGGQLASQELLCESIGHNYQHCPTPFPGQVELIEQLSRSDCDQGRTWGSDNNGVWVDGGCRARFRVHGDEPAQRPMGRNWKPVGVCQDEIRRQVRQTQGAGSNVDFGRPQSRQLANGQRLISGNGTIGSRRNRRGIEYSCRIDPDRRYLVAADFDELQRQSRPPVDHPPSGLVLTPQDTGSGQPVDARGVERVCRDFIARKVLAERGQDKQVIWGVFPSYEELPELGQARIGGRGGTFVGQRRDSTFDVECQVEYATGRIVTYSYRYN